MRREQTPTWVGPLTAALIILVLAFIGVLLAMTVFASGEEDEESGEPAAYHILYQVSLHG